MELFVCGCISFTTLLGILGLHHKLSKLRLLLRNIESIDSVTPALLLQKLQKLSPEILKSIGWKDTGTEIIGKVFISGVARAVKPIKSILDNATPLIYSLYYSDYLYSNDREVYFNEFNHIRMPSNKNNTLISVASRFTLEDPTARKIFCTVFKNYSVKVVDALTPLKFIRKLRKLSFLETLFIALGYLINKWLDKTKPEQKLKGMRVGIVEREFGIKDNSHLVVFGEFLYNKLEKTIKIIKPEYFLRSKGSYQRKVANEFFQKKILLILVYIPFIVSSTIFLLKLYQAYKLWKSNQPSSSAQNPLRNINFIKTKNPKCLVCAKNTSSLVLNPCKHLCICKQCFQIQSKRQCPECRKNVSDYIELYIS